MLYLANIKISKLKYFVKNMYLSSISNNGIRTPFIDVVIKSLLQTLASICPFITEKDKILMELLFYSGIVLISDWKYTKSVGIKKIKFSGLVPAVTAVMSFSLIYSRATSYFDCISV